MEMWQLKQNIFFKNKDGPLRQFVIWDTSLQSVKVDEVQLWTINVFQSWEMFSIRRQLTDVSKSPSLKACSGAFGKKGWLVQGASATGIEITPSSKSAFVRSHADTFLRQILVKFEIFEIFVGKPQTVKPVLWVDVKTTDENGQFVSQSHLNIAKIILIIL